MPSTDHPRINSDVQHEIFNTFSGLLEGPAGGHVLFYPERKQDGGGTVGDGGYVRKGCFWREFNVYWSPLEGTTALTLLPNDLDTRTRSNPPYAMRSSTSLALNFKASVTANAVPMIPTDSTPLSIIPEISIDVNEDKFAFMALCGAVREVQTLHRSQRRKIVEWFFQNQGAVLARCEDSNIVFVTQTVRSAGWVGGVAIERSHDVSGQVAAGAQILDVSVHGSTTRANNIGLVPTQGPAPDAAIPWSQHAAPDYTIVMSYTMIKWRDRVRHRLSSALRVLSSAPQDSSLEQSRKDKTSRSLLARPLHHQDVDPSSSSSTDHLQALLSHATSMGVNNIAFDARADVGDDDKENDDEEDDELEEHVDDTILSGLLARALRRTGADVAVADRVIITEYINRYGAIPDMSSESVVLRLAVKAHDNGRTAVEILSIARDANEPDEFHEMMNAGVRDAPTPNSESEAVARTVSAPDVVDDQEPPRYTFAMGDAFDSRLKPLVIAVDEIHNRCLNVKQNRAQCLKLYEFCLEIVSILDGCIKDGLSLEDKARQVDALLRVFITTAMEVQTISNFSLTESSLKYDAAGATINTFREKLTDALMALEPSSRLALQKFTAEFAAAAAEDRHRADAMDSIFEPHSKFNDLNKKLNDLEESTRALATSTSVHARLEPSLSPEADATTLAVLRLLSIQQSGSPRLDIHAVEKVGSAPVSHRLRASLWRGISLADGMPLALRVPRGARGGNALTPEDAMLLHRSIGILRGLEHANVIPLLGVKYGSRGYGDGDEPSAVEFIAFPWLKNGNILSFLGNYPGADRLKLMFEVACALRYLHNQSPPIVHRAIQPSNILVDDEGSAVLSDFSISKALDDLTSTTYEVADGLQDSLRWMAPEVGEGQYDRPADVYSWAMLALYVLSGVQPFAHRTQPGRIVIDVIRGLRPKREDHLSPVLTDEIWRLLQRCWAQDPAERPTMVTVANEIAAMRPDLRII